MDGRLVTDPEFPVVQGRHRIELDGALLGKPLRMYLMLNKPRGLVTTAADEHGRDTVYRCLDDSGLPWLSPVGRLDKASEGLLLFCNDPEWAAVITDPDRGPAKTYHVQVDVVPDAALMERLTHSAVFDGEPLTAKSVTLLRAGARNAWLEIVLEEGRNRQIRRLLAAHDIGVLRLIRVAIGSLVLGELEKGRYRQLRPQEISMLVATNTQC